MNTSAFLALVALSASTHCAFSGIKTEVVEYKDGDTLLEGVVVYDDAQGGVRPGVLVVHDWTGLGDYAKRRATMLAELGYVAFCADIYGKGIRPTDPADCAKEAGKYKGDLPLLRKRVTLGFDQLLKQKNVDAQKTAAIGYCFGGTTVLELARSGAPVRGVVSFHGNLATKLPAQQGGVKAKVLVCHGADDPFVKPAEVEDFRHEMDVAMVDYELISYPGAVHSFTKKEAGDDKSKGSAYQEAADVQSWKEMQKLFAKIFAK
jgi:dienelactone hydrolase